MKKHLILILFTCICTTSVLADDTTAQAIETLKKSAQKLQQLNVISYTYQREINNYKDNYFARSKADCYIDFEKPTAANSFIFQFRSKDYIEIYNGSEYFILDATDKTIEIIEKPVKKNFSSLSFFYNSIPTLRNTLNSIADDDAVTKKLSDTILVNTKYTMISLGMTGKVIDYAGGYRSLPAQFTTYYKILIDNRNGLPYQIIETNSEDKELYHTRVTFLNLKTGIPQETDLQQKNRLAQQSGLPQETELHKKAKLAQQTSFSDSPAVKQPDKNSWYYSSWQPAYHFNKKATMLPLISSGKQVNDWALPVIESTDLNKKTAKKVVKRDDFKGKVVVMYFWIKNCGACMESFPYLKALQKKYGKQAFQLLSINSYDEQKDVDFFYKRENPAYMILYNGKKLAAELGIYSYPSIVIIGKDGKVTESLIGFNKEKTDQLIQKALAIQP